MLATLKGTPTEFLLKLSNESIPQMGKSANFNTYV